MYTRLIALGRFRLGFFASPAAICSPGQLMPTDDTKELITHSNDLGPKERESSLGHHSPPSCPKNGEMNYREPKACITLTQELSFVSTDPVVLYKRARVFPVSET